MEPAERARAGETSKSTRGTKVHRFLTPILVAVGSASELDTLVEFGCSVEAPREGRLAVVTATRSGQRPARAAVPDRFNGVEETVSTLVGATPGNDF